MFKITDDALAELSDTTYQGGTILRLTVTGEDPLRFDLIPDTMKNGDTVIRTAKGQEVLLIAQFQNKQFNDMVLDFRETGEGKRFVLDKDIRYRGGRE